MFVIAADTPERLPRTVAWTCVVIASLALWWLIIVGVGALL